MERLPALFSGGAKEQKSFNNEREILYQVLFDMKKDMTDLKKLVHDIMNGNITDVNNQDMHFNSTFVNHRDAIITSPTAPTVEIINEMPVRDSKQFVSNADEYLDAEVYHDDAVVPTTLEDMEIHLYLFFYHKLHHPLPHLKLKIFLHSIHLLFLKHLTHLCFKKRR